MDQVVLDLEILEKRLWHRNADSEESIKRRLAKATYEMSFESEFDKILISDKLEGTLKTAEELVTTYLFPQNNS